MFAQNSCGANEPVTSVDISLSKNSVLNSGMLHPFRITINCQDLTAEELQERACSQVANSHKYHGSIEITSCSEITQVH
jgi:hypothetical protein